MNIAPHKIFQIFGIDVPARSTCVNALKSSFAFLAKVSIPIIWRTIQIFAAFLLWPVLPALLWNWSPNTNLHMIGVEVGTRLEWLLITPGIGYICALILVVAFMIRAYTVANES